VSINYVDGSQRAIPLHYTAIAKDGRNSEARMRGPVAGFLSESEDERAYSCVSRESQAGDFARY